MAYADQGMLGSVVVGPDGKKYRFSCDDLVAAEERMKPAPKPKPAPKKKPAAKKSLKRKSREIDK